LYGAKFWPIYSWGQILAGAKFWQQAKFCMGPNFSQKNIFSKIKFGWGQILAGPNFSMVQILAEVFFFSKILAGAKF
jgi:hypothetical protein